MFQLVNLLRNLNFWRFWGSFKPLSLSFLGVISTFRILDLLRNLGYARGLIRKAIQTILCLGLFLALQQGIEKKTRGFCLQKLFANDLLTLPEWDGPALSWEEEQEIHSLLSQPYSFLGAGSECFAFMSQDGKTVIKFFKLDIARPVYLHRGMFLEDYSTYAGTISHLELPWMKKLGKRLLGMREFRIQRTFHSLKLALSHFKEETGLIFLHLNPTKSNYPILTLYDPCGISHKVNLNTTRFFLQKRAISMESHLLSLKSEGALEQAKRCIDSFIQLIANRCKKGVADRDILTRNFGCLDQQTIEIDAGSFLSSPMMKNPWVYRQELFYATLELMAWLRKNYPELSTYLKIRTAEEIHSSLSQGDSL